MSSELKRMHMGQITSFFIPNVTLVGQNCSREIPNRLKALGGKHPLVVTDKGIVACGILKQITDILDDAKVAYTVFDVAVPNPTDKNVEDATKVYLDNKCDSLISIGGGSSHDCAKGIGRNGDIRAINIHGSLLPRWRGAAPLARAIESGDAESGVVLMKMEQGLDTGPMIRTVRTPITQEDTSDTLMMRLAELGAELLVESLRTPDELDWTPQPEEGVTYAEKLLKTEAVIDWTLPAKVLANKVRAFNPFPGTVFDKDGVPVKIWQAEALELSGRPGEVLDTTNGLVIACGEGALRATVLQKPGKPKMAFGPFLQSLPFTVGEVVK